MRMLLITTLIVMGSVVNQPAVAAPGTANGAILFEAWDAVGDGYDLYVMEPGASEAINVTNAAGFDADATWSPDGRRIAFASNRAGMDRGYDIYLMDADGQNLKRLTKMRDTEAFPTWSPDGRRIAFSRGHELWVMNADGSRQRKVYTGPRTDGRFDGELDYLSWSPDGSRIAFNRDMGDGTGLDIWTIRPNGTAPRRIYASPIDDLQPEFSPDGRSIVLQENTCIEAPGRRTCYGDIIVIDRRGKQATNLTNSPMGPELDPTWSPDGTQIAYTDGDPLQGVDIDIWVMNADGSDPAPLTVRPQSSEYGADWQPLR